MKRSPIKRVGKVGRRNRADKTRITPGLKAKSGGRCMHCGRWPDWRGLQRHRKVYGSQGGWYTEENTELWCAPCHFGVDGHRTEVK